MLKFLTHKTPNGWSAMSSRATYKGWSARDLDGNLDRLPTEEDLNKRIREKIAYTQMTSRPIGDDEYEIVRAPLLDYEDED